MVNVNKTSTVETLFTLQVKAVEDLLSYQIQSATDRSTSGPCLTLLLWE